MANDWYRYHTRTDPVTVAQRTIYWFLHGRRYSPFPTHFNCRCVANPRIPQPQGSHL